MLKQLKAEIRLIGRGLSAIRRLDAWLIPISCVNSALEALSPFINIYMASLLMNGIIQRTGWQSLLRLMMIALGLNLALEIIKATSLHLTKYRSSLFHRAFQMMLSGKVLDMDYENVENPAIQLKRTRIEELRRMNGGGLAHLTRTFAGLIKALVSIVFALSLTVSLFTTPPPQGLTGLSAWLCSPWCSVILIATVVVSALLNMRFTDVSVKKAYTTMDEMMSINRIFGYYFGQYINSYHAGKDIRIFKQAPLVIQETNKMVTDGYDILLRVSQTQSKYQQLSAILPGVISFMVYALVAVKALVGLLDIGGIVRYVGGVSQFITGFSNLMSEIGMLRTNNEALQVYFDFIDIPNKKYLGTIPVEKRTDNEYEIEFKNVSFKYPGSDIWVLKNLSLKLNIGKKLAVVGMNGSGKTTFIKLLCRLYDPTEGVITLNGIDIKKYNYDEYMAIFSVVFQDFKLFSFSLGQNVATDMAYDSNKAITALLESGFDERLTHMEKGLETCLYKDFDEKGVEVSGGEAQKIALARALYKNAPYIVLDEPTAALDPISEFEIYSRFNDIVGNKTAIYISHRLSSCRFCDDIAVFHEGQIIQRGNHDTLVADTHGKYYELWNAQAQYYTEEAV